MFSNITGGPLYHFRALRYRNSLWVPFRQQVAGFLDGWQPRENELLILGPSGGHTLPTDFLERFDRLWLFDPDPMAPYFFKRNHPGLKTEWSRENLILNDGKFAPEKLMNWLNDKDVAVLFSNLLGQLPLLAEVEEMKVWWQAIQPELKKHSWLTYHDLFSFPGNAELPPKLKSEPVVPQLVDWAIQKQQPLELIDHGTNDLIETKEAWTWNISPRRTHVVGGTSYRPS